MKRPTLRQRYLLLVAAFALTLLVGIRTGGGGDGRTKAASKSSSPAKKGRGAAGSPGGGDVDRLLEAGGWSLEEICSRYHRENGRER